MQAHFKSYTCTQCNQEISSNETLRSHMFRMHSISRMFMCRCCNWAFPDKTSLHIHMQSMSRNGTPGDVAVLARSSDDGVCDTNTPSRSPTYSADGLLKHHIGNANSISSIFPNLLTPKMEESSSNMLPTMAPMSQGQILTAWLTNNPIIANLALSRNNNTCNPTREEDDEEEKSDYDELEVHTTEEDLKEEEASKVSPTSVIVSSKDHKRKLAFDDAADIDVEGDDGEPPMKMMSLEDKESHLSISQPSPTVSDSHISGSSSNVGESPSKCFDCQVAKGKLSASEIKLHEYEKKIGELQTQIELMKRFPMEQIRAMGGMFNQMMPPVVANPQFNFLQNPAMKMLLSNFMQSQLNRQMC